MKIWYRFVCAFVAVAVVLCSVRVPDVDADEILYHNESQINVVGDGFSDFLNNYNCDDYDLYKQTMIDLALEKDYDLSNDYIFACYINETDIAYVYNFYYVKNGSDVNITFDDDIIFSNTFIYRCNYSVIKSTSKYSNISIVNVIGTQTMLFDSSNDYKYNNSYVFLLPEQKILKFAYDNDFSVGMDLTTLPQQFTLTATNETNNYYNYVFYISSSPASAGVQKSFSESVFIMSSNQWCMKYSWSSLMPDDDVSISDWIKDSFGRVIDPWGNIFNPEQSYMGRHSSGSSDDGIYYYTLSQQKKCPFYLIKPKDSRAHVIPYSALNLSLDTTYYANIIYLDTTAYGVVPSSNSWGAADTSHNNYRSHPLYNLNLISRFAVYSSTEFSFVNGNFTKDDDGLYDYKDVVDNSNPGASSATISSEDNSVSINNANSYDNSSSVSYINYGTIYHNCSWSGSGSGGSSGARPAVPELPEAEFENLYDQSRNFFDFVADVLDSVGAVPALFIAAAFAVLLFLRIWGR